MEHGRKYYVTKNLIYGITSQILMTFFPFISRTVFIYTLGKSYLGISGLFTSILSVLSLAELGLGNIVIYSLYKPVAEHDEMKIAAYTQYYKKMYRTIAGIVFIVGIMLAPFLDYLVNLPDEIPYITLYYILYVVNSAVSYLMVYKVSVIRAAQLQYVISLYTTVFFGIMHVLQVVVLLLCRSFTAYLIVQILCTIGQNYALSKEADKRFPYINNKRVKIKPNESKKIVQDVKAMFLYKIGGVLLNSTDNIYISVLISTVVVGVYNNYVLLVNVINKIINIVYDAIYTSVGNLNASDDIEKKRKIFRVLVFIFVWIATFSSVGILTCINDVTRIWIGSEYECERLAVIALTVNFYLPIVLYPVWMYRNTTGLFEEAKNILIYAAIINLILSGILGKIWGLPGILISTSIARMLTSFWYEPYVLCKKIFTRKQLRSYFFYIVYGVSIIVGASLGINYLTTAIQNVWIKLFVKIVLSVLVPSVCFIIVICKTDEWNFLKLQIKEKLKKL